MAYIGSQSHKPSLFRAIPVYIVNIVLLVLSTRTVDFVAMDNIHVILFIAPLFYWTIHQPAVIPLWFVFLGGIYIDFSVDGLLGLHAFSFIVYMLILYRIRRIILSQPSLYHFVIFALSVVVFEALRWLLLSLLTFHIMPILPSILSIILNLVAFMPLWLVFRALHRVMSGNGR
jgi:rod shape-determining protein MreD